MSSAMDLDTDTGPSTKPSAVEIDSDNDADADADPIVASYNVYTNPRLPDKRKLLVLQHPNRQGPVRIPYKQISEVRLKNASGFVEVDVPIAHGQADYDRDKGLRWGSALARSVAAKNGGSHGLAGGFGVGVPARAAAGGAAAGGRGGAGKRPDTLEHELSMLDWSEAVRQDKVLRTQTLGGYLPQEKETNCRWMVGVFKGDQLHLTPVTSLVHLRPQLHHLDAYTEQERLSRPREGTGAAGPATGAAGAAGGAAGKEGAGSGASGSGASAAKAIHMSIKSAGGAESGEAAVDTMIERLRKVQMEPWTRLRYEDEDSDRAWNMFHNNLVYAGAGSKAAATDDVKGKGKEKGKPNALEHDAASEQQKYQAQWREDEFLRAVSGVTDTQQGEVKQQGDDEVQIKAEVINQTPAEAVKKVGVAKGKGKAVVDTTAAGPATTPTVRKGVRGKSVAFKES